MREPAQTAGWARGVADGPAGNGSRMSDFEITALVLAEHEIFRRDFAALDELSGQDLATAW